MKVNKLRHTCFKIKSEKVISKLDEEIAMF